MARQRGAIHVKGKLGDMVFYQLNGKSVVRMNDTRRGERIKTDDAFKHTRGNKSVFTGCMYLSTQLHRMARLYGGGVYWKTNNTLAAKFRKLLFRGQPEQVGHVRASAAYGLAKGYRFDNGTTAFDGKETLNATSTLVTYRLDDLLLTAPSGSTHFEVVLIQGAWKDVLRQPNGMGEFDYVRPAYDNACAVSSSGYVPLGTTSVQLQGDPLITTAFNVYIRGIRFYQEVNGQYYPLEGGVVGVL